jgi:probable rRNA maturation factor
MTRRVARAEAPEADEVDVVLADDAVLHELNARYRGKDRATDVLAFPGAGPGPFRHLGEVVISTDRAIAQARSLDHSIADEVSRLLVHGILHLTGYEHDTPAGRRAMRDAERRHVERLAEWIERLRDRYAEVEP